jgi:hypothetical protein
MHGTRGICRVHPTTLSYDRENLGLLLVERNRLDYQQFRRVNEQLFMSSWSLF